jgi:transposase
MTNTLTITLEQYLNEISQCKRTIESQSDEIRVLKEQLEWLKRQVFGKKSEKFVDKNEDQLWLEGFDQIIPAAPEEKQDIPAHQRKKRQSNGKDKISIPDDLPIERQVLDIPEEEKVCPETGEPLVKIGEEVTSKLAHKPGSYFIKQIVRPKYAHPKKSEEGVFTADLPESLLNRCIADESLLADILVKKFGNHPPLYR